MPGYPEPGKTFIPAPLDDLRWVQVFDVLDMSGKPVRVGPWPSWVAVRVVPELPDCDLEQVTAGGMKATMATLEGVQRGLSR